MIRSRKRLAWLLFLLMIVFLGLILYLSLFQLVSAGELKENAYNKRNWMDETKVQRGRFIDMQGKVLVESQPQSDGTNKRVAHFPYHYAQLIGYNSKVYGKSGLEAKYNSYLLNIQNDNLFGKLKGNVLKADIGNDVHLTLNHRLQEVAHQALKGKRGAVVAIEPASGRVLALVSQPSFNANRIEEEWNSIVENKNSPLLNRPIQGLYTPGSVMKVLTATALLENNVNLDYEDKGSAVIGGYKVVNLNGKAYGSIGLQKALVHSSNVYFAQKAVDLGAAAMKESAELFYINKDIPFELPVTKSRVSYQAGMGQTELAASGYGQGESLLTPLNLGLAIAAVANDGVMKQPFIVEKVMAPSGTVLEQAKPKTLSVVGSPANMKILQAALLATVKENRSAASIRGHQVAGKTGTAQTSSGRAHAWFIGYAPYENPQIAVAVIVEEAGGSGGKIAAPIAGKMFNYWLNQR
ncbi:MAG TPA: penicillin-binding protein A [Clostridiales bacterium]|jgi:peptidoglycan glycosyltransferase|nr:penicillin-binding protein A [Clostridiales bacterium]